ncbi:hypothetical protein [Lactobacillus melliventris]|uniref:Uncharacterized protein n=1 Tax=Lactobacillus melliventris TaxID=1218507 RepID=A0A0F4L761_9LACO|nr:hypothetical protein [Lactobacillus melliventris]KJY54697.1 hypothetical protein JF74_18720 [Lactobacillus melliventris]
MNQNSLTIELDEFPELTGIFSSYEFNARLIYKLSYYTLGDFSNDNVIYKNKRYYITIDNKWLDMKIDSKNFIKVLEHLLFDLKNSNSIFLQMAYQLSHKPQHFFTFVSHKIFTINSKVMIPGLREYLLQSYFITPVDSNYSPLAQKYIIQENKNEKKVTLVLNKKACLPEKKINFIINKDVDHTVELIKNGIIDISSSTNYCNYTNDNGLKRYHQSSSLLYYFSTKNDKEFYLLRSLINDIHSLYLQKFNGLIPVTSFLYDLRSQTNIRHDTVKMQDNFSNKKVTIAYSNYQQNKDIIFCLKTILIDKGIPFKLVEHETLESLTSDNTSDIKLLVTYRDFQHYGASILSLLSIVRNPQKLLQSWLLDDTDNIIKYSNQQNRLVPIFKGTQIYLKSRKANNWDYDSNGFLQKHNIRIDAI